VRDCCCGMFELKLSLQCDVHVVRLWCDGRVRLENASVLSCSDQLLFCDRSYVTRKVVP
jgi:hypothetical protein